MENDDRSLLEGKVAGILSEVELVINIGARQGVKRGMIFAVLAATPLEFRDPDTGELLMVVDRPKVQVRVTRVDEHAAICATYRTHTIGGGILAGLTGFSSMYEPARTIRETLKADDSALPAPLDESESYVKVGDRVREVGEEVGEERK